MLIEEYDFPVEQAAIYYIFDRDPLSNTNPELINTYIDTLKDPYDNGIYQAGMLLLSYPSIEAYIISAFEGDTNHRFMLGKDCKAYIGENNFIQMNKFSDVELLDAANAFLEFVKNIDDEIDIDGFSDTSKKIFDKQEADYLTGAGFQLFSMLTLSFLQLGIITIKEECRDESGESVEAN